MAIPIIDSNFICCDDEGNLISTIQFSDNMNYAPVDDNPLQYDSPYIYLTVGYDPDTGWNLVGGQIVIIPSDTNSGYALGSPGVGRANGNVDVTLNYNPAGPMPFTCDSMDGWFSYQDSEEIIQATYSCTVPKGTTRKGVIILQPMH
jgi:hypothetical protein